MEAQIALKPPPYTSQTVASHPLDRNTISGIFENTLAIPICAATISASILLIHISRRLFRRKPGRRGLQAVPKNDVSDGRSGTRDRQEGTGTSGPLVFAVNTESHQEVPTQFTFGRRIRRQILQINIFIATFSSTPSLTLILLLS